MTTELAVQQQGGMVMFTKEQKELIKRTIAQKATDDELSMFLELCSRRGLDPFTRQVYFMKGNDGRVTVITAIDGLRCNAERTKRYVPGDTTYTEDKMGNLISATVSVKSLVAGQWHTVSETAYLSEYKQNLPIWNKMPRVMLAKCAEARALRRTFPEDMSGLYAPEEMNVDISTGEIFDAAPEPQETPQLPEQKPQAEDTLTRLINAFAGKGVELATLEAFLGRPSVQWDSADINVLREAYKQLKSGVRTAEELFAPKTWEEAESDGI